MNPGFYTHRALLDVDGVVLSLMEGFQRWLEEYQGVYITIGDKSDYNISRWEGVRNCAPVSGHEIGKVLFPKFLGWDGSYDEDFTPLIHDARKGVEVIRSLFKEVAFCTHVPEYAPESYVYKVHRLHAEFPGVPVLVVPAECKRWVGTDLGIDDRWDVVEGYREAGANGILFDQPWNGAPEGVTGHTWTDIVAMLR